MLMCTSLATSRGLLGVKHGGNVSDVSKRWICFKWNVNFGACGHLDDTTGAEWRHVMCFSVGFLRLKINH